VLRNTLERRNQACDFLAAKAREMQKFRRFDLRKLAYRDTRDMFGLTAQVVVRCIAKVAYAYKPDRQSQRSFRRISVRPYDDRAYHSHWPAGLKRRGTEAAKRRLRKLSGRQWRI
jgi:putative transposase